jgi:uncharacterized protein
VPGERDLQKMLSTIGVERRPGTFTYVTGDWPALAVEAAVAVGAPIEFRGAWLTLTVFSALEAVGLTAAVARALADEGIPCNVLAGYHHDHMLVPEERAGDAMRVLRRLRSP